MRLPYIELNGRKYTTDGTVEEPTWTNEELSQAEIQFFHDNKPEHYFAYVLETSKLLQTWAGDVLGDVKTLYHYTSNFGDSRCNIRVKAVNGLYYYGTWYTDYDYCRIHKYSNQSRGSYLYHYGR